jgi:hypothetical protein
MICFSRSFASPPLRPSLPPRRSTALLGLLPLPPGGLLFTALRSPVAWSSSAAYWLRCGRGRGRKSGRSGTAGGRDTTGGSQWPSVYNPWTGTIHMWPGPSGGASPRHPSTGLLCCSTSDSALGTSSAAAGAPSPSGASDPARVGAVDKWVGHAVSRQLLLHDDAGPTHLGL